MKKQKLTTKVENMSKDFEDIKYYIKQAEEYGLLQEVIISAIKTAQANPSYEPEVIMDMACDDWDIWSYFFPTRKAITHTPIAVASLHKESKMAIVNASSFINIITLKFN